MDYTTALQLTIARSPFAMHEASKALRALRLDNPNAVARASRAINAGLTDPQAQWTKAEREQLAALVVPGDPPRDTTITIRVSREFKASLEKAANGDVGPWIREILKREIGEC